MSGRSRTSAARLAGITLGIAVAFMLVFTSRTATGLLGTLALTAPGFLVLAAFLLSDVRDARDLAASGPALSSRLLAYLAVLAVALLAAAGLEGVSHGLDTHAAVRPAALAMVGAGFALFRYGTKRRTTPS